VKTIRSNTEIEWLYDRSETEMGFSAIDYEALSGGCGTGASAGLLFQLDPVARGCEPGWLSPPTPTDRQVKAAQRQRWYRQALCEITGRHRAAIDCAYQIRDLNGLPDVMNVPSGPRLVADWGLAAPVVRRILLGRHEVEMVAEQRISDAGKAKAYALRNGTQLDVSAAMAEVTEAKQALRREQVASGEAAERSAQLLDDALRAYEAVRRRHRAEAKAELDESRACGKARRQAFLSELLDLPQREQLRARAMGWLEELKNRAAAAPDPRGLMSVDTFEDDEVSDGGYPDPAGWQFGEDWV